MAGITQISDAIVEAQAGVSATTTAATEDLWIFRDGKRTVSGPQLVRDLCRRAGSAVDYSALLDAFIQAGELEAALSDAGTESRSDAATVTNCLASAAVRGDHSRIREAVQLLETMDAPATLSIAPPEGFTYYALHPTDFARIVSRLPTHEQHYAVVGIRSIGTTLSAVVQAELTAEGKHASRITVRPHGHPYSRRTQFSPDDMAWIHQNSQAHFLVVDEGPGRSGSTFLSVAEALMRAGVPSQEITILGSRQPDLGSLCADNAAARWSEFRFFATTPSINRRFEECAYLGGGNWRQFLIPEGNQWPASWTQMERLKFMSADRRTLYKFEGMGPIGVKVRQRAHALADSKWGPPIRDAGDGFLAYELLQGAGASFENKNGSSVMILESLAEYCAFRYAEFPEKPLHEAPGLREMLEFNVLQEFGQELSLPQDAFCTDRPVVTDGCMQPYEWISVSPKHLIKTDGTDHGDNHFFPGPCDIAWDLAGISVEWQLRPDAMDYLLDAFRSYSRVDISSRLGFYQLAYAVFRLGFSKMAISTVKGSPEEERLKSSYQHYRALAHQLLQELRLTQ